MCKTAPVLLLLILLFLFFVDIICVGGRGYTFLETPRISPPEALQPQQQSQGGVAVAAPMPDMAPPLEAAWV